MANFFEHADLTFSIKPAPMEVVSIGETGERNAKQNYLYNTGVRP